MLNTKIRKKGPVIIFKKLRSNKIENSLFNIKSNLSKISDFYKIISENSNFCLVYKYYFGHSNMEKMNFQEHY